MTLYVSFLLRNKSDTHDEKPFCIWKNVNRTGQVNTDDSNCLEGNKTKEIAF